MPFFPPSFDGKQLAMDKRRLWFAPREIPHALLDIRHKAWRDSLRFTNHAACRVHRHDAASVLAYDGSSLTLKWDNWGVETFNLNAEGEYVLAPTD